VNPHRAADLPFRLREAHALGITPPATFKPANVMLLRQQDDHDFVKVLDFGLVKFFFGRQPRRRIITTPGRSMGCLTTSPRTGPEQSPDQRCDILFAGACCCTTCSPVGPFTRSGARRHSSSSTWHDGRPCRSGSCAPIFRIRPSCRRAVLRCMAKARAAVPSHGRAARAPQGGAGAPHWKSQRPTRCRPQTGPQPQARPSE